MTSMTRVQISTLQRAASGKEIDAFDYNPATIKSLESCGWIKKTEEKWRGPAGWVGTYRITEAGHAALLSMAQP